MGIYFMKLCLLSAVSAPETDGSLLKRRPKTFFYLICPTTNSPTKKSHQRSKWRGWGVQGGGRDPSKKTTSGGARMVKVDPHPHRQPTPPFIIISGNLFFTFTFTYIRWKRIIFPTKSLDKFIGEPPPLWRPYIDMRVRGWKRASGVVELSSDWERNVGLFPWIGTQPHALAFGKMPTWRQWKAVEGPFLLNTLENHWSC